MLDVSTTRATGMVDTLRFMGDSRKETVQAPIGLLRQEVTLSTQLQDYYRRRFVMNEYRMLVSSIKQQSAGPGVGGGGGGARPLSPKGGGGTQRFSGEGVTEDPHLYQQHDAPPIEHDESPSLERDPLDGSILHGNPQQPMWSLPLMSNSSIASRGGAEVMSSHGSNRLHDSGHVITSFDTVESGDQDGSPAYREDQQQRALASTLIRAALSLSERYLPCFYCAKDFLHVEFAAHTAHCKVATEALLRKQFLNPLRYAEYIPQVSMSPIDCTEDELDEYAVECSRCIGKSLIPCPHCKRKYNIHELQKHTTKCIGRSSGPLLELYAALAIKKQQQPPRAVSPSSTTSGADRR